MQRASRSVRADHMVCMRWRTSCTNAPTYPWQPYPIHEGCRCPVVAFKSLLRCAGAIFHAENNPHVGSVCPHAESVAHPICLQHCAKASKNVFVHIKTLMARASRYIHLPCVGLIEPGTIPSRWRPCRPASTQTPSDDSVAMR